MPSDSILLTAANAEQGIGLATAKYDRQVHAPKWQMLTQAEQSVAQALAVVGGSQPRDRTVLSTRLPAAHRPQFEAACDGLVRKDVVFEAGGGRLAFSNPGTEVWILHHRPPSGSPMHVLQGSPPQRQLGSVAPGSGQQAAYLGHRLGSSQPGRHAIGGP